MALSAAHISLLRQATQRRLAAAARLSTATAPRSMCTSSTSPHYAQPNQFVSGVTTDQMENSQAMRDWYHANFPSWKDDPEKYIVTDPSLEVGATTTTAANTNDDDDDTTSSAAVEEEITSNPHAITLPPELTARNIRPLVAYLRDPTTESGTRACDR